MPCPDVVSRTLRYQPGIRRWLRARRPWLTVVWRRYGGHFGTMRKQRVWVPSETSVLGRSGDADRRQSWRRRVPGELSDEEV